MAERSALGIRVKSGWASAVLIASDGEGIRFVSRARLLLSDPRVAKSSQPFHRGFGALQKDARILRRLVGIVRAAARQSLGEYLRVCRADGQRPRTIALVVGSTIDPERIGNEHIRAHASEARLFRESLEDAAARLKLGHSVIRGRDLPGEARSVLGPGAAQAVSALGEQAGRPWRQDEKLAALAAWLLLARP